MKIHAILLAAAAAFACGPKPAPKPKLPPPQPPAKQLGETCTPKGQTVGQGNCATGLTCLPTSADATFCTSVCPCGGGGQCTASQSEPELCLKTCKSDADCHGLSCNADYQVCAP